MNIFDFRDQLTADYAAYMQRFLQIRDDRVRAYIQDKLAEGLLWSEALS